MYEHCKYFEWIDPEESYCEVTNWCKLYHTECTLWVNENFNENETCDDIKYDNVQLTLF